MSTSPDFANFSSTTGLALNGSATQFSNDLLLQTQDHESGTAFWTQKLDVTSFSTTFDLQATAHAGVDDYYTFALQNGTTTALGADDIDSGYAGGTLPAQSAAISFTTENLGSGSGIQFLSGNGAPVFNNFVQMPGIDMSTTDSFSVVASYDGTNLAVTVTDLNHTADTFSTTDAIDLPTVLGGNTAYAGFTVGSGSDNTYTAFQSWSYTQGSSSTTPVTPTPPPAPTFTQAATASVGSAGTTINLSAQASISDSSALTYNWVTLSKPTAAGLPVFSNAASNTTLAALNDAGTYSFRVTATSADGTSTTSEVSIVVSQRAARLVIEPHGLKVQKKKHGTFTASVQDQFSHALTTQPTIKFYVIKGGGTINYKTGLYTAGTKTGELEIEAKGDGFAGKALESVG